MLSAEESEARRLRRRLRHARTCECIRWAQVELMELYPEECLYGNKKNDGYALQLNHPEEYKKLLRSRREYLNETDPLPILRESKEKDYREPSEIKIRSKLTDRLDALEAKVEELERWRDQNDMDGLEEV